MLKSRFLPCRRLRSGGARNDKSWGGWEAPSTAQVPLGSRGFLGWAFSFAPLGLRFCPGPLTHGLRPFDFAQGRLWAALLRRSAARALSYPAKCRGGQQGRALLPPYPQRTRMRVGQPARNCLTPAAVVRDGMTTDGVGQCQARENGRSLHAPKNRPAPIPRLGRDDNVLAGRAWSG